MRRRNTKNEPGPADNSDIQSTTEEPASDNNNTISAEKNLLTVDINIPNLDERNILATYALPPPDRVKTLDKLFN